MRPPLAKLKRIVSFVFLGSLFAARFGTYRVVSLYRRLDLGMEFEVLTVLRGGV
jgi:hypothetical protein